MKRLEGTALWDRPDQPTSPLFLTASPNLVIGPVGLLAGMVGWATPSLRLLISHLLGWWEGHPSVFQLPLFKGPVRTETPPPFTKLLQSSQPPPRIPFLITDIRN